MNFIKKNIIFSIVAAITLIASAYLIFQDLLTHSSISQLNEQTQSSKERFEAAYRSGNRPVDQNILRIQKDTEELRVLTADLQRIFGKEHPRFGNALWIGDGGKGFKGTWVYRGSIGNDA